MMKVLLLVIGQASWASTPTIVQDLRPHWLVYMKNSYQLLEASSAINLHTIYFRVNGRKLKGQYLRVKNAREWDLCVNGKLIFTGREKLFNVDSLSLFYSEELFFGVHSETGVHELKTLVVSPYAVPSTGSQELIILPPTFFRDYSIIITAFLLLFLLVLFRTNPQLTLDYFSFAKIFSVQERNENLLVSRIASSVNLLFYLFCALLGGFLLSTVFYFAGSYFLAAKSISITSFGDA